MNARWLIPAALLAAVGTALAGIGEVMDADRVALVEKVEIPSGPALVRREDRRVDGACGAPAGHGGFSPGSVARSNSRRSGPMSATLAPPPNATAKLVVRSGPSVSR